MTAPSASAQYLLARLALVEERVREAVARRRAADPDPDDPVRGLYVSDHHVDAMLSGQGTRLGVHPPSPEHLAEVERQADDLMEPGRDLRLRRLAATFGLDRGDVDILLVALAPDLDPRYERLYGYLHDDVTRRRASVGLALELTGSSPADHRARRRLVPGARLVDHHLVTVEDADRPVLTRSLRVGDRVTAYLLGDDAPDPQIASLTVSSPDVDLPGSEQVARALREGARLVYVRDRPGAAGHALAVAALARAGHAALEVDLRRLDPDADAAQVAGLAAREAGLTGRGLVAGPLDALEERILPGVVRALSAGTGAAVLVGGIAWEPGWVGEVPLQVEAPLADARARRVMWGRALDEASVPFDPAAATAPFRLTPEQARRAGRSARLQALAAGRDVGVGDLRAGAREQNAGRLEHLARRVEPQASFDDLVLPDRVVALLREVVQRARHRDRVLDEWHMGGQGVRGRGITALFAGESGTGKTLSAEVIAGALGLDLYAIDLSTVVDKYIGETEKNLERIFDQAEGVNGVLFFDEADALFGKRSEVSDARDRYANVEIAFLLQRMEFFDGIAILATNLRANLDEAFTRRIDVLVDFPEPEEADRRRLWGLHLPDALPRDDDLDLDYLAKAFKLSGGDIRNITVAAAYAAAVEDRPLATEHLVRATAREYRKLGRLVTESEFGPYFDLIMEPSA